MTITKDSTPPPTGKEGDAFILLQFPQKVQDKYTGRDSDCRDIPQPFSDPRHYEGALAMETQGVESRKYFLEITVGPGDRFSVRNYIPTERNFDKKYTIKAPIEGMPVPVIVKFIEACNACTPHTNEQYRSEDGDFGANTIRSNHTKGFVRRCVCCRVSRY